jgi:hypothetical protein
LKLPPLLVVAEQVGDLGGIAQLATIPVRDTL